jgi:hypothetical protein
MKGNDDESVAALVGLERASYLPLLAAVPCASWGNGFLSLGRYDTASTAQGVGSTWATCQTTGQPVVSGSSLRPSREAHLTQPGPVHLLDPTSQIRASPVTINHSIDFLKSRTFLGRTFFSPGIGVRRNHEESGMTSPFGAVQFV